MRTQTLLRLLAAALTVFALSACNTIHGAGKDIERAGEKVQETARDARD